MSPTALRKLKMFIAAATVALAGLLYVSLPVMAQEETITVFVPPQTIEVNSDCRPDDPLPCSIEFRPPGFAITCTGGPPFTVGGNCEQRGQVPVGAICDIPTTVVFPYYEGPGGTGPQIGEFTAQAFQCRQPEPTTKDQCKNGGYATFGFRNQGECVSFVNKDTKGST